MTALVITLLVKLRSPPNPFRTRGVLGLLWGLDPLGFALFFPSIVCVLVALQWGDSTYAYSNPRMIALLVVFGVTLVAFVASQAWLGNDRATIPPRIGLQRTVWSASLFSFCLSGAFFLLIYFIPIYFQAVKGTNALRSGIDNIALILSNVVGIILAGALTTKFGYYMPFIYVCVVLTSVGAGMLTTLEPGSGTGRWVGYQILYGLGCGCGFQLPQIAAQAVLPFADVQTGIAVTLFFQNFGGALFVSVGNNVLGSKLLAYVDALDLPGVSGRAVVDAGATGLRGAGVVPPQYLDQVVAAYNHALQDTFRVALVLSCLSVLAAAMMEWKSVKAPSQAPGAQKDEQTATV